MVRAMDMSMVATAQRKQGIWMFFFFFRWENTVNLPKLLKICFTQVIYLQQGDIFEVLKIKGCTRIVVQLQSFGFKANFDLGDNPIME